MRAALPRVPRAHRTPRMARAIVAVALGALGCVAPMCEAADGTDGTPPNEFWLGLYAIFYHLSAQNLSGPFVPPGVNVTIHDVQTVYLAYVRSLPCRFNFELDLGIPPLTKTYGKGPATLGSVPFNGRQILTARWFAPSALINYNFFDDSHALRPFIGVGVTYVDFYDREITAAGNAIAGGPTHVSLTSSIGPNVTAGLTYRIAPRWAVHASYSLARVRTFLSADTAGIFRTTHVSFGPAALIVSGGYSF